MYVSILVEVLAFLKEAVRVRARARPSDSYTLFLGADLT